VDSLYHSLPTLNSIFSRSLSHSFSLSLLISISISLALPLALCSLSLPACAASAALAGAEGAAEGEGELDVLQGRELGEEVEGLEDKAPGREKRRGEWGADNYGWAEVGGRKSDDCERGRERDGDSEGARTGRKQ
jgi:hypothetical protein